MTMNLPLQSVSDGGESRSDPVTVVLVTVPDAGTGTELARALVEDRLAACGNVMPGLTSVYRWQGEVQQDPESLVILKTTMASLDALKERVLELHPYDVPEFLALPVIFGHLPYLQWVDGQVKKHEES